MACASCWQPRSPRVVYGGSSISVNANGMVPLASYPDCDEPYNDLEHRAETLYVVGWNTELERVFTGARSKRAIGYATSHSPRLRNEPALATQLCRQAVLDAYAETD